MIAYNTTDPANGAGRRSKPGRRTVTEGNTPSLFDPPHRHHWTDDLHGLNTGQREALAGLNAGHRAAAAAELERLAASGRSFTADDLREALDGVVVGPSSNWVGALFSGASRSGLIRQVGWTRSTRDVAKLHTLRVWVGTAGEVAA